MKTLYIQVPFSRRLLCPNSMRLFVEKTKKTLKTRFYFKTTNVYYKSFLHLLIFLKIVTKTKFSARFRTASALIANIFIILTR